MGKDKEKIEFICPIMDKVCPQDKCQLWDPDNELCCIHSGECALEAIAENLSYIRDILEEIRDKPN